MNKLKDFTLDVLSILFVIIISVPLAVLIGICWLIANAFKRAFK